MCRGRSVEVRGPLGDWFCYHAQSQGLNSSHWTWQQAGFPAEPSLQLRLFYRDATLLLDGNQLPSTSGSAEWWQSFGAALGTLPCASDPTVVLLSPPLSSLASDVLCFPPRKIKLSLFRDAQPVLKLLATGRLLEGNLLRVKHIYTWAA